MARERSIVVRLRAEIDGFRNAMGQASRSLSDFEREQQKMGGAADTAMGRLVQNARINEREWTNVGRALTVTGGAITGLGAAALKAGIDYNSLRQTATKSLESVTGSTEGAAKQMQRLDDYGKNSWIARDVLIRAQQNMTGFGIETSKVIPYMDGLAEAVAAAGGSEQDFEELARVMGQIQSQGKITARELNQFGIRGVDAAQMIGDAMGKTANEIREDISSGALDAGEALDALSEGMVMNFEGSSDRIRDTFSGALSNLSAAWRDLGAEFAKPLVNPEGGGFLVDMTNNVADFLNAIGSLPGPVKTAIGAIVGLTGVITLGGGAIMMALPKIDSLTTDIRKLANTDSNIGRFTSGMGKLVNVTGRLIGLSAGIATAATVIAQVFTAAKSETVFPGMNELTNKLEELAEAGKTAADIDLTSIVSELPELFGVTTIEAENLGDVMDKVLNPDGTDKLVNLFGDSMPTYMRDNRQIVEELDDALVKMLNAGGSERSAAIEFMENLGYSSAEVKELLPGATDAIIGLEDAADGAGANTEELVGALEEVGIAADGTVDSLTEYLDLLFATGLAAMSERDAHAQYEESLRDVGDAVDEIIENHGGLSAALNDSKTDFDLTTEAGKLAQDAFHDIAKSGMDTADAMAENGASQEAVQAHLKQTRDDLIEAANKFDITGTAAEELADEVLGVPDGVDIETWIDDYAQQKVEELAEKMGLVPEDLMIEADADTSPADGRIDFLLNRFDEKPNPLIVDADTEPADGRVDFLLNRVGSTTTSTNVDADTSPAEGSTGRLYSTIDSKTTNTNVDANTVPAEGSTGRLYSAIAGTTTDTNVDANTLPAVGTTTSLFNQIANTTTDTNVDANTSPAAGTTGQLYSSIANTTTTTKIDADTSPAQSAWSTFRSSIGNLTTRISAIFSPGKYEGGFINPGLHSGGEVQPGLKAGGWVPGQRAGYDNVLWPLHSGGQVLAQPLEGREFVVNSRDAARYPQELNAMNNGTYPTGTLERAYSPTQQIDYQKLATALRGREHIEQHMHLHTANATITDGIDGFNRMNMAESRR